MGPRTLSGEAPSGSLPAVKRAEATRKRTLGLAEEEDRSLQSKAAKRVREASAD